MSLSRVCRTGKKKIPSPIKESAGALPLRRTGFGKKKHPFEIEIAPYIAIGIIASPPNNKEWDNCFLTANKAHTTRIKNNPS